MMLARLFLFINSSNRLSGGEIPKVRLLDSGGNPLFDSGDNPLYAVEVV